MPTLDEDLAMRESVDVAVILREVPDKANAQLAAMWHDVLGRRDPVEIVRLDSTTKRSTPRGARRRR